MAGLDPPELARPPRRLRPDLGHPLRRGPKPDISVYFAGRKPPAPGPFPSPLGPVERAALGEVKGTLDAVGESSVRWLGRDDTLLIDSLLVIPGRQAVELHGDVAR